MITHFSLLEMHTDISTNCTLLGPVDCDSFYKWIPLNRWPVAISSEVLHFIYCAISISLSLIYVHHIIHCFIHLLQSDRAGSKVWVWRKVSGFYTSGGLYDVLIKQRSRKDDQWFKFNHDHFVTCCRKSLYLSHTHTHTTSSAVFFSLINIFKCFHPKIVKANHVTYLSTKQGHIPVYNVFDVITVYHT